VNLDQQRGYARTHAGRGWFVTFEGPEGSGKTVQAARLRDAALAAGIATTLSREPGGTPLGDRIRHILMDAGQDSVALGPRADALLFNAARAQHVDDVLRPALARGELVICARYADSTLAYQGYGSGLPIPALAELQALATDGLRPDLTILLDVPVEIGLGRKGSDEQQRFEAGFDVAYHQRVREGFRRLAAAEPDRFVSLDATASEADVEAQVRAAVSSLAGLEVLAAVPAGAGAGEPERPALRTTR
jgi:dTMP kinase